MPSGCYPKPAINPEKLVYPPHLQVPIYTTGDKRLPTGWRHCRYNGAPCLEKRRDRYPTLRITFDFDTYKYRGWIGDFRSATRYDVMDLIHFISDTARANTRTR